MSRTGLEDISRLLVVGAARSGAAAALAARRMLPHTEVILADKDSGPKAGLDTAALDEAGVRLELGREDNLLLDDCGLVVKSPGVPRENPLLMEAGLRGIPVWGEVEFAWRFLGNIVVGVTGTNGKTTTTELIGHVLASAGRRCRVAGNVGIALSSLVGETGEDEILVVELSSFQLEDAIGFRPDVGILLNLTEDHLDRHPDIEDYFAAKLRIFENQNAEDVSIINLDDPNCRRHVPGHASRVWFSRSAGDARPEAGEHAEPMVFVRDEMIRANLRGLEVASAGLRARLPAAGAGGSAGGSGRNGGDGGEVRNGEGTREETGSHGILDWTEAALKGDHNLDNCLAAAAACLCLGLSPAETAAGLASFEGVPHRLQEVRVVDGVTYVNDSKATNTDATIKALTAYRRGVHLILGGRSKGLDFDELARGVAAAGVEEAILMGEAAGEIAESFERLGGVDIEMAAGLDGALAAAREHAAPGDVVLFSPACASFDQYDNYEQRGAHFINIVNGFQAREDPR